VGTRTENLKLANERRMALAEVKRDIRAGKIDVLALVRGESEHEELVVHLRLKPLLASIPGLGPVRMQRVYGTISRGARPFNPERKLGDMPQNRREELVQVLTTLGVPNAKQVERVQRRDAA
jgi:hypothetical protein